MLARGRDAADVAVTHTFGQAILTQFEVITEELAAQPQARGRTAA
jgi:hypothetical protein